MYTSDVEGEVVVSKPTAGMYGSSSPARARIHVTVGRAGGEGLEGDGIQLLDPSTPRTPAEHHQDLWRGVKDVRITGQEAFFDEGGVEAAPLSTTTSLETALMYGSSTSTALMRLTTTTFMMRGASLRYLSAFPQEEEILYPPLTYLQPTGPPVEVRVELDDGTRVTYTVLNVVPHIGS